MTDAPATPRLRCDGTVTANAAVSRELVRLDAVLDHPTAFLPGQFAMLNLTGRDLLVFSRPFSLLAAAGASVSFLYRVVGRGTSALRTLRAGDRLSFLGPLGRPFPEPAPEVPAVLVAGGVGLPPLFAWLERYGRPQDVACFGARDGGDVPWDLLGSRWAVSVDDPAGLPADQTAFHGLVTGLAAARTTDLQGPRTVLACGPLPLLRAAANLAAERGWDCWLSLEEHMGCGYGVCKGCVVPVYDPRADGGWRNATCCDEGPVFRADAIAWERHGAASAPSAD
jgi:dihydroorotate dehydrogenase electron transfer subunit